VAATVFARQRILRTAIAFVLLAPFSEEFVFDIAGATVTLAHLVGTIGIVYTGLQWRDIRRNFQRSNLALLIAAFLVVAIVSSIPQLSVSTWTESPGFAQSPQMRAAIESLRLAFSISAGFFLVYAFSSASAIKTLLGYIAASGAFQATASIVVLALAYAKIITNSIPQLALEYFSLGRVNPFRFTGFQEEPKNLAFFLLITMAITSYLWVNEEKKTLFGIRYSALWAVQLIGIIGATSIASGIALAIAISGFAVGITIKYGLQYLKELGRKWVIPTAVIGIIAVSLVGVTSLFSSEQKGFWQNQWTKITDFSPETTSGHKSDRYAADWNAFTTYPVIGVGYGRFPYYFDNFTPDDSVANGFSGNQSFLTGIPANTGIIGVVIALAVAFTLHQRILGSQSRSTQNLPNDQALFAYMLLWITIGILAMHDDSLKLHILLPLTAVMLLSKGQNQHNEN